MNKCLKAQIAAAFVADIAFGSKPVAPRVRKPVTGERITGTLSLRH